MSIKLYHQVGHNYNWNVESYTDDGCGDGLIMSPVHQSADTIKKLAPELKAKSLFDPQYYLPGSRKTKLNTYDFFPETISGGFTTVSFSSIARESANRCVGFQIEEGFSGLVIPARHFPEMNPDYIPNQTTYTVEPFLQEIAKRGANQPVWLTLPLTGAMIKHEAYRKSILNWVTSYPEITGVYVIVEDNRETKQVQSHELLTAQMEFLTELRYAELDVLMGHCNTEALLYTLIEGCSITFGSFENTRMFSIDKFISSAEERRGPRARIYLAGLLNWIQFVQAKNIKNEAADIWESIYESNQYGDDSLASNTEPYFNQPTLYKHHFMNMHKQVSELSNLSIGDRYAQLREWIVKAIELDEKLRKRNFDLERHGRGDHLQPWLDVINSYYRRHI